MSPQYQNENSNSRLIAGVIILAAGLLFMLNNFNVLPFNIRHYVFSWKTLLIAIGALNLLFSHNRTAGFILITVGVAFWIPDIFNLPMNSGKFIWPLAIMAVGIFLLFKGPDGRLGNRFWEDKFNRQSYDDDSNEPNEQGNFSHDDYIDNVSIFGGGEQVITSKNFKGGKMTAIFGGSAVRLHHAKLAPGRQVLDVFFMFGGAEISVPTDWAVKTEVVAIFGGFSDKRYLPKPENNIDEAKSVLVIKGLVIFGGGELKSY